MNVERLLTRIRLGEDSSQVRLIRFEEQAVPGAAFRDLDPLLVDRFTVADQGDPAVQLKRLHLLTDTDAGPAPTVAGVLLCTLAPHRWLRNAEIIAVAHRDYSCAAQRIRLFLFADRLEIYTPGALPNSITIESMTAISAPRNEVIASLYARYYPVENRGTRLFHRRAPMCLPQRGSRALRR